MKTAIALVLASTTARADVVVEKIRAHDKRTTTTLRYGAAFVGGEPDQLQLVLVTARLTCDAEGDINSLTVGVRNNGTGIVSENANIASNIPADKIKLSRSTKHGRAHGTITFDYNDPAHRKDGNAHYKVHGNFDVPVCKVKK